MSVRKPLLALSLLIFAVTFTSGQGISDLDWGEYSLFTENQELDNEHDKSVYLRFYNTNFFKNNEYKNELVKGQSLIGLFLEPSLDFYIGSKTRIRTGLHFLKFHGQDKFNRLRPVLTLQHQVNPRFSILFGSIYGNSNHGLLEPIMGFERHLNNHDENGIQFLLKYPGIRADIWLNWEQFIEKGDPFQEHFTTGAHMLAPLINQGKWQIGADFQVLFRHKGGEIDSSDLPAGTQSNISGGLKIKYQTQSSFVESFNVNLFSLAFFEINPGEHINVTNGYAQYPQVGFSSKFGNLMLGYWTGSDFFAPHGEPLFLSRSNSTGEYYQAERELLILKYQVNWLLADYINLAFRFEPYYDIQKNRIDHSMGLYLLLDQDFLLKEFRK